MPSCPCCDQHAHYVGFHTNIECSNPKCRHYFVSPEERVNSESIESLKEKFVERVWSGLYLSNHFMIWSRNKPGNQVIELRTNFKPVVYEILNIKIWNRQKSFSSAALTLSSTKYGPTEVLGFFDVEKVEFSNKKIIYLRVILANKASTFCQQTWAIPLELQ